MAYSWIYTPETNVCRNVHKLFYFRRLQMQDSNKVRKIEN